MDESRSTEDIFLELMREETGDSSLSQDQALKMPLARALLRTLQKRASPEAIADAKLPKQAASTAPLSNSSLSPAILKSAIRHTFSLEELEANESERTALVASAELVMIAGERRLCLNDARRAEILAAAQDTELYTNILRQAIAEDAIPATKANNDALRLPSIWLRKFLSGTVPDLSNAPPNVLNAALEARKRLRLVKDLPGQALSVDDIARRVELAELLKPLRLLVGAEGGWDGSPSRDRFVGREDALTTLRAFVDELSSKSIGEGLWRGISRVQQALWGSDKPGIMVIEAHGGLGKSTLLAKFVLDHALGQERPFPFAYLDFDRASLDPQRPQQLLIEIARQVGLQFPDVRPELNQLANDLRAEFLGSTVSANIGNPFARFVEIVGERVTHRNRAFLLVFDTMEAVQWDSVAMDKLASLLYEFRDKRLDELKVVVSGRADVPEFRWARGGSAAKNIELGPLQMKEAREMAETLGRTAIGTAWNSSWCSVVAGKEEDAARREPLAVRVAVDLIARAKPEERQKLADEVSSSGLDSNQDFIARMYLKRVVNHVRNPLAQALAWPGLVVRRVTVQIIRELLAPLCKIQPDQAENAFEALGREVWMVTREGDALKHRQDLRARTLPLMRNMEPERFEEIARKAVEYFGMRRDRSPEDRAEWIYQRFLIGESPQQVARDWQEDILTLLARAAEDFPPQSPAASYLASRTAKSRLSPSRIRDLQPNDALYHLSRTSAGTFALDDLLFDPVTQEVSQRIGDTEQIASPLDGWARALWIKTGAWQKVARQSIRPESLDNPLLRTHVYWAARIAPTLPNEERKRLVNKFIALNLGMESTGLRSSVQALALARTSDGEAFTELDEKIANMLRRTKPNSISSTQAALRTAIVLGKASRGPALRLWLASRRRGISDRVQVPTISLAEIKALMKLNPQADDYFYRVIKEAGDQPARFTDPEVVRMADRMLEEEVVLVLDQLEGKATQLLARVFACRDEDWTIPVAYAAERAYKKQPSRALSRLLVGYNRNNQEKTNEVARNDMVVSMRNADEAGELAEFASTVLAECDLERLEAKELRFLLDCRNAWQQAIRSVIGADEEQASDPRPSKGMFSATLEKIRSSVGMGDDAETIETSTLSPSERPPEPGPIHDFDDPQKGRWGGQSTRDGREVRVVIDSVERDIFYFSVVVESIDSTPLAPPVVFHMHDSFPRSVITVRRVENRQAILREWNAYGVFTIGVQLKNASGEWTSLEIDLANAPGLPKRFLKR